MIRKYARERREYLYRKSLDAKEKDKYEKKQKIRKALAEGTPIPTELRVEEDELRREIELEDETTKIPKSVVDDEYAKSGLADPKLFITTSRDPSSRLMQFAKELKLIFPNSQRMNRGNHILRQVIDACRAKAVTDIIVVHETRGQPDGLIVSHLPYGPTAYFGLLNCVLRHDLPERKTISLSYPHLLFHQFNSSLGGRTMNILKNLFPVPKDESQRVITFANQDDFISFRHHSYEQKGNEVELEELGPRFEMKLYQIKLGTLDQADADLEWSLRPFMNTNKKRNFL